jgi:8-oxo-dGTP pyrophosphatase MutT (NUDIX family)
VDVQVHRVAATVVMLRTGVDGPEVLMLERPHDRGSFAGAWVFPGGSVDAADGLECVPRLRPDAAEEPAARRAAVREVREETSLALTEDSLTLVSCWTPPAVVPRRFRTWFYYAQAPEGEVVLSPQESIGFQWMRPASALALHAAGGLQLVPPTWVTLHALREEATVEEALNRARKATYRQYATRVYAPERGQVLLWHGDVAYDDDAQYTGDGPLHRLDTRTLPWQYTRTGP